VTETINQTAHEAAAMAVVESGIGYLGDNGVLYLGERANEAMVIYNRPLAMPALPKQRTGDVISEAEALHG